MPVEAILVQCNLTRRFPRAECGLRTEDCDRVRRILEYIAVVTQFPWKRQHSQKNSTPSRRQLAVRRFPCKRSRFLQIDLTRDDVDVWLWWNVGRRDADPRLCWRDASRGRREVVTRLKQRDALQADSKQKSSSETGTDDGTAFLHAGRAP